MSTKKTVVKVVIGGDEFSLRSDRSDAYTRAVAHHVDLAMKEVRATSQLIESHKAAILAALAITVRRPLGSRSRHQALATRPGRLPDRTTRGRAPRATR